MKIYVDIDDTEDKHTTIMEQNLVNIVPDKYNEYKVAFDSNLAKNGIEIFNYLIENNKVQPTHSFHNIVYRWAFGISGPDSIQFVINNLSKDLGFIFKKEIIEYLGLQNLGVNEVKFERIGPNEYVKDVHLKRSRFGDISSVMEDNLPSNYESTIFYSALWHTDKSFALNNYKILVYLNDIEKEQGGVTISEPVISPKFVNSSCWLFNEGIKVDADKITGNEVIGRAGTTASFNSHILHRANLPLDGFRYCMHLSFLLPEERFFHPPYSKVHF